MNNDPINDEITHYTCIQCEKLLPTNKYTPSDLRKHHYLCKQCTKLRKQIKIDKAHQLHTQQKLELEDTIESLKTNSCCLICKNTFEVYPGNHICEACNNDLYTGFNTLIIISYRDW